MTPTKSHAPITAAYRYRLVGPDGAVGEELTADVPVEGNTMRAQIQQVIARRHGVLRMDVVITGRALCETCGSPSSVHTAEECFK